MVGDPAGCGVAIVEAGGEGMLRCKAVRDGDDRAGRRVRESAAHGVDGVERPEHPAATEEVDEDRKRFGGFGDVHADGYVLALGVQHAILDVSDRLREHALEPGELRPACLGDRELVQRACARRLSLAKERLHLGMECGGRHQI